MYFPCRGMPRCGAGILPIRASAESAGSNRAQPAQAFAYCAGMSEERQEAALDMALRWCLGVELQLDRLAEAERAVEATVTDRAMLGTSEGQRRFARLRVDSHLLLVAARDLLRALDDLARIGIPANAAAAMPPSMSAKIKTLRNCLEHWDQRAAANVGRRLSGKAYRDFVRDYPGDDPGSYEFGGGMTVVGGLDLGALRDATMAVSLSLEKEAGRSSLEWEFP